MPEFRHRFRAKFDNVDYARVLYFPRQIDLYVEALEEFCRQELGVSFRHMIDVERVVMPTVHLEVDYRAPLLYEQEADIALIVRAMGEKSTLVIAASRRRSPFLVGPVRARLQHLAFEYKMQYIHLY